ncbi:MAG: biosynthetic arginine decarboxylase [Deltaproteobacteria bacterium]|nr:biosynthetic arginine decarboxylase [Deltaproteobacteria bacterium]
MNNNSVPHKWTLADSIELYEVQTWGAPYFGVNDKGHIIVYGDNPNAAADLKELVDEVKRRGIGLPLLLRFNNILSRRLIELNEAFRLAIAESGYQGEYRGVYPIKVNQVANVVEQILKVGQVYHYGLEAGSKPELLVVMALLDDEEALIICNGYKDEEYVEPALLASKLGRKVILVVEKLSELKVIANVSKRVGVRPHIGVRVKLSTRGAGKWESSGGDRSKFGLSSSELMEAINFMREHELIDCFELLHFHLGSQISNIRNFKSALREGGRFYVELSKMGAPLHYFDVGGGLGVDYDGSQTNFDSSMNYTRQEYANDLIYAMKEMCDTGGVPHPTIVTESGRAVVAHHSVLVIDVLGVREFENKSLPETLPEGTSQVVKNLWATYKELTRKNVLESYHDALDFKEESLQLFSLGHLSLMQRVLAENIFWSICHKVLKIRNSLEDIPEDLESLDRMLSDTYYCNFSIFQSLPDSWAVDHLFPVMPIHRLTEEPTRRAVLADITCDSDGKLERFIDRRDIRHVLELHPWKGEDYYLGIFLVGAYQEILGDLHNLFGNTNDVQVTIPESGGYFIEHVAPGDTVTEVLRYVNYSRDDIMARMRRATELALRTQRITLDESRYLLRSFEDGLSGYTYLERD